MSKKIKRKLRKRIPILAFIILAITLLTVSILLPFVIVYKLKFQKEWNIFQKDFENSLTTLDNTIIKDNPVATLKSSKLISTQYYEVTYRDVFTVTDNDKGTTLTIEFKEHFSKKTVFSINKVEIDENWSNNTNYFWSQLIR